MANEKGFEYHGDWYYDIQNNNILSYGFDRLRYNKGLLIFAATQSLLQRWLRETHKIHIEIIVQLSDEFPINYCLGVLEDKIGYDDSKSSWEYWNTYEKALEAALKQGLNLIK